MKRKVFAALLVLTLVAMLGITFFALSGMRKGISATDLVK